MQKAEGGYGGEGGKRATFPCHYGEKAEATATAMATGGEEEEAPLIKCDAHFD